MKRLLPTLTACFLASLAALQAAPSGSPPNIIIILADDMGVGDVKILGGQTSQIATPHLDAFAKEGMIFSDAHTSSAVCTPTRYSLLTGRYNWRSTLKSSVLGGMSPPLIAADRPTVAGFMKNQGYVTACIGKWHLGMHLPTTDGRPAFNKVTKDVLHQPLAPGATNVDWKGTITGGPTTNGFDHYFGISASLDMEPYIWIENDRFVGEATTAKAFHRPGPAQADFEAVDVLGEITRKSIGFIQANKDKPMFLYIPFTSPHTPIVPSKDWQGKSGLGTYGDFVMETDWAVGQIVKAVDEAGLGENTLILFTADNGCSPAARSGMQKLVFNGAKSEPIQPDMHYPSGIYRGTKADLFEGGHRVPFIARWKGKVAPGTINAGTICQTDLYATCAELLGQKLTAPEAPDSVSILPYLFGTAKAPLREATVHHSITGDFAIRKGAWKLLLCADSGGWSAPRRGKDPVDGLPPVQLFDLAKDPGETTNLQADHPEIVAELKTLLTRYIKEGRSTPGEKQANDGPERWKQISWMD